MSLEKMLPDDREKALDALAADTRAPLLSDRPPRDDWRPAAGMDRAGMPPLQDLARYEVAALQRLSPRRRRWAKLDEFDQRAAEFEQRLTRVQSELRELIERQRAAPEQDAQRLADWHLAGAKGERPEPEGDRLAETIAALERDRDALDRATGRVLADKAVYVEGNRSKLAADAAKDAAAAREAYAAAIEQLEASRRHLVDCRLTELWAQTYPHAAAGREPQFMGWVARNIVDRLRRAGVTVGLDVPQLGRLLREDVDALASAVDPEQRAVIEGHDGRRGAGVWLATDEGRAAYRAEKQAALARHRREWGQQPGW